MNVITLWVSEDWEQSVLAAFVEDLSAWLVKGGLGNDGSDAPLRSVLTATTVDLQDLSREEFVSLVAGGQGMVVLPRTEGEPEAYIPPEGEPQVPQEEETKIEGQMELDDYARGYSDGYETGRKEGYDQGYAEGLGAAKPEEESE